MRRIRQKELMYDCIICGQPKGQPCIITRGKNKGKPTTAEHEWGRRPPPTVVVTQKEIGNVLTGMVSRFNEELFALTEDELRTTRWYWKYDDSLSVAYNIYKFSDALEMYRSSCRRWEEHHNGHVCVVERVRDKYLMPKIKEFEEILHGKIQT